MKYKTFEELPIWKESIGLGKEIYILTSTGKFEKDYSFKDQIRRAILSISSNVAEGFERSNNNEFDSLAKQIGSFVSYLRKQKKEGNFTNK